MDWDVNDKLKIVGTLDWFVGRKVPVLLGFLLFGYIVCAGRRERIQGLERIFILKGYFCLSLPPFAHIHQNTPHYSSKDYYTYKYCKVFKMFTQSYMVVGCLYLFSSTS